MKWKGNWKEIPSPVYGCRAFRWGVCTVFVGLEPMGRNGEMVWHLSISCPNRYPSWEEIKTARYDFVPDEVTMAMVLPPRDEYVNVHKNCFHLHQIEGEPQLITVVA